MQALFRETQFFFRRDAHEPILGFVHLPLAGLHASLHSHTQAVQAGSHSIPQIADGLADLAEKTRTASFEVNDTRGGTFTISNAGAVGGSRYSTPIINPPQSAVLALGRTRPQPWVVDGQVVPRLIMPLSLSFDHRLIDGAQEVHFMRRIITALENPGEELTT